MTPDNCKRRRAPDGSIEVLFSAEFVDDLCPCGKPDDECPAPGPTEDDVEVFEHDGAAFGRRLRGDT